MSTPEPETEPAWQAFGSKVVLKLRSLLSPTHTVAQGEAAGLKLYAPRADLNFARGTYEPPMQAAIAANLSPGGVFYDVGANIGFFSLIAARRVGAKGSVYSFEPVPSNADAIRRSAELNDMSNIEVFANAVGAKSGRAELLLTRHIGGATLASAGTPGDVSGRIEVDLVTLDETIARRSLRAPTLVKIDVEGAEIDVLEGMRETLRTHRPKIIYEIDDATVEGLAPKARAAADFLTGFGYALSPLPASYRNTGWQVEHVLALP